MLTNTKTPRSPDWWLARLLGELVDVQRPQVEKNARFLSGDHPLPPIDEGTDGVAFRRFLATARSNYLSLVVEAVIERMRVTGFRAGASDKAGDDATMALWRGAHLDADQALVHRSTIGLSRGFVMVGNHPRRRGKVLITVEDPRYVTTIAYRDDPRDVEAALKVWVGDDGFHKAAVYLPTATFIYSGPQAAEGDSDQILYRRELVSQWSFEKSVRNPVGIVPVVPFHNRRDAAGKALSEFEDVLDIQNRINATLLHRLVAEKFASFRQKAILNLELDTEEIADPDNPGQTIERAVRPQLPSHPGVTWLLEGEHLGMWESEQTSTADILKGVEADIRDLAAITRTPPHYLLGSIVNASGDALKAAETGLVSKVRERLAQAGESWELVLRLAHLFNGDTERGGVDAVLEVVWQDPESRSLAEVSDAAVKQMAAGVPWRTRMALLGKTPAEIDRMETERAQDAMIAALAAPPPAQQLGAVPSQRATPEEEADAVEAEAA